MHISHATRVSARKTLARPRWGEQSALRRSSRRHV